MRSARRATPAPQPSPPSWDRSGRRSRPRARRGLEAERGDPAGDEQPDPAIRRTALTGPARTQADTAPPGWPGSTPEGFGKCESPCSCARVDRRTLLIEPSEVFVGTRRARCKLDCGSKMRLGARERPLLRVDHAGEIVQRGAGRIGAQPIGDRSLRSGEILCVEELGDPLDRFLERRLRGRRRVQHDQDCREHHPAPSAHRGGCGGGASAPPGASLPPGTAGVASRFASCRR